MRDQDLISRLQAVLNEFEGEHEDPYAHLSDAELVHHIRHLREDLRPSRLPMMVAGTGGLDELNDAPHVGRTSFERLSDRALVARIAELRREVAAQWADRRLPLDIGDDT